jgi:hypothetical protein
MAPRVELPPAEAPPVPAPLVQPALPPVMEAPPTPSPVIEAPRTPAAERAPVEAPAVPAPPVERIVPQKIETPARIPESVAPKEMPVTPQAPAIERAPPRVIEREPPVRVEPAMRAPSIAPSIAPSVAPSTAPSVAPGNPAVDEFGFPIATPKAGQGVDLDAARRRARELARQGGGQSAIFAFPMPPAPVRKSKEEIAFEKARKPDCRTAYQALGLAAVVPLIANEFGEGTCRW